MRTYRVIVPIFLKLSAVHENYFLGHILVYKQIGVGAQIGLLLIMMIKEQRRKPVTPLSYSARGQEPWGHPDTCQARSRGAAPPGQKGAQSSVPAPTAGRPAQYHQEAGVPGGPLPLSPPAPSPSQ